MAYLRTLVAVLAIGSFAEAPFAAETIRLAQTSTVTNCMMNCNSRGAACQSSCIVGGTLTTVTTISKTTTRLGATTSNATASSTCLLNCSSQQLACHTDCALHSPSP